MARRVKTNNPLSKGRQLQIAELAEFIAVENSTGRQTDLEAIRASEDLQLHYDHYEGAFDGMLVADGSEFHVHVDLDSGNHPGQRRSRFTVAHEFGHYFIDEHRLGLLSGAIEPHGSRQNIKSQEPIEIEANYFASCLLMPKARFRSSLTSRKFSAAVIEKVVDDFDVSFPAATIRFASAGNHEIMAVMTKDGIAKWFTKSDDFCPGPFRFKVGQPVPPTTVVGEHFAGKNSRLNGVERVDADDWFYVYDQWASRQMYEQCIYRDEWGYVISLLWFD